MKKYLLFIIILIISFSNISFANIEKGTWNFIKDSDYCFIGSLPTKEEIPEGKKRGKVYLIVYRINKDPEAVIQINSGYPYKEGEPVMVKIDKTNYQFYSEEDSAWTNEDNKIIIAMKKGIKLTVTGISSKGTKTIDTYTLNGFTNAFTKLSKDC